MRSPGIALALLLSSAFPAFGFDAANPRNSGYEMTFDDEFDSVATIDLTNSQAPGFKWYVQYPYGGAAAPADRFSISNGVITISPQTGDHTQWMMSTGTKGLNATGFVGQAFGGEWYIEARIAFDDSLVNKANGFPAFWAEGLGHVMHGGAIDDQWTGQIAGYEHWLEDDFFEYNVASAVGANAFNSNVYDWYGKYPRLRAVGPHYPQTIVLLDPTTWTSFHTIGRLHVPGTAQNGWVGIEKTFFDGVDVTNGHYLQPYTWIGNQMPGTPPPSGTFLYSIADSQSLVIVLGSGIGAPLQVDYVRVWQPK